MQNKNKYNRPKSVQEQMADAVKDAHTQRLRDIQRAKQQKRMKQFGWLRDVPGWINTVIKIALFIILILALDGIRRENAEFSASIVNYAGFVQVYKDGAISPESAARNSSLHDGDIITTGENSSATLSFADGSAIQLEPNTQLVVRLLDFSRGSVRDRSFMVNYGSITARISSMFGINSRTTVCTPTSVAAARGTGFQLRYEPQANQTKLLVYDGSVSYQNGYNVVNANGGTSVVSSYYETSKPQVVSRSTVNYVGGKVNSLGIYESIPSTIQDTEYSLNAFLDPVLQFIGFAPGGWGYKSIDFSRRGACMEALGKLQVAIEGTGGQAVPDYINSVTLGELQLPEPEKKAILDAFSGKMLLSYVKTGTDKYEIMVRARDRKKTLYELNQMGPSALPGQ